MTDFVGWTPPPGVAVVAPPCHPETRIDVIYSDGQIVYGTYALRHNWSSVGDGPSVVAYAIVEEYKPAPREFWIVDECEAYDSLAEAQAGLSQIRSTKQAIIHVREVMPAAREVVAWAVVLGDEENIVIFRRERLAHSYAKNTGGTLVRLTGVMPS